MIGVSSSKSRSPGGPAGPPGGRRMSELLAAGLGERRVGRHRAGERPAEARDVGRAVLSGLPEVVRRDAGDVGAEVPHALPLGPALAGQRPVRVELGADRRGGAADAGANMAERLGGGRVRLELDVRVRVAVGKWPDISERCREIAAAVRPVRYVAVALKIEVAVLEGILKAEGNRRVLRGLHPVDEERAVPLGEAPAVGELTQRSRGVELLDRAGDRPALPLGRGVLADERGGVARALARLALALETTDAGLEHLRVGERGTIGEFHREGKFVADRRAGLAVPDLLLHEHAALERRPGRLVLWPGGVVLGVEAERLPGAVRDAGVLEAVRGAGHHEPCLMCCQVGY